jgi:hypothetical protein
VSEIVKHVDDTWLDRARRGAFDTTAAKREKLKTSGEARARPR